MLPFRAMVTNVRYTVTVNGKMTFPGYDPEPAQTALATVISSDSAVSSLVSVFTGTMTGVYKLRDHYSLVIEGSVTKAVKTGLETAIRVAWNNKGMLCL